MSKAMSQQGHAVGCRCLLAGDCAEKVEGQGRGDAHRPHLNFWWCSSIDSGSFSWGKERERVAAAWHHCRKPPQKQEKGNHNSAATQKITMGTYTTPTTWEAPTTKLLWAGSRPGQGSNEEQRSSATTATTTTA